MILHSTPLKRLEIQHTNVYNSPSLDSIYPIKNIIDIVLLHVKMHVGEMFPQSIVRVGPRNSAKPQSWLQTLRVGELELDCCNII